MLTSLLVLAIHMFPRCLPQHVTLHSTVGNGFSEFQLLSRACILVLQEEEEELQPRSRRAEAVIEEEDEDDEDDDDEYIEEGGFKCSTVVADGLPKGPGIPTEVHLSPCWHTLHACHMLSACFTI